MNLPLFLLLAVFGLAGYGAYRLTKDARRGLAARRLQRRQEEEDERSFWEYEAKHDAIRTKFDPRNEWNEATAVPAAYKREISELNVQYKPMLQRRNGWTAGDFEDSDV